MTHINRQRYMAELSKLLTFMFKEDRDEILQHYNRLLDESDDPDALLAEFGSPTKLAVTISRSYDRNAHKLTIIPASRETAEAKDTPAETEAAETPEAPESAEPASPQEEVTAAVAAPIQKEPEPETAFVGSYEDIVEEIRRERAAEQGI